MDRYEVVVRNKRTGDRWTYTVWATDFFLAYFEASHMDSIDRMEEIIEIRKDYDPDA